MIGHSEDVTCPSHLVPFEIVRISLHFYSLKYYEFVFFDILWTTPSEAGYEDGLQIFFVFLIILE